MESEALKTDLYELTMAAGYFQSDDNRRACFELYCHTLPRERSFLVTAGLQHALEYLLRLRFQDEDIQFLRSHPVFSRVDQKFFDYLGGFRFTGDVWAMEEGEISFADEPLIQVEAPIIEAQLVETYLLSIFNLETLVASKAARVVEAASCDGVPRGVVDFGSRRAQGPEAGVAAARAAYLAGCLGTSNVHAGRKYGIPVFGTMAHSWVQAFDTEQEAFQKYQEIFPGTAVLLIDTYDTEEGARKAVSLGGKIQGVRLDSGNLLRLSRRVRKILDEEGRPEIKIIASGNLNEFKIKRLVEQKAPIDLFGVGTEMVVSADAPALDLTYKLVQIRDRQGLVEFKAKFSQGKNTTPGRKQVYRRVDQNGRFISDTLALAEEKAPPGTMPLLHQVVRQGQLVTALPTADQIRERVAKRMKNLPSALRQLPSKAAYRVTMTPQIRKVKQTLQKLYEVPKHGQKNPYR